MFVAQWQSGGGSPTVGGSSPSNTLKVIIMKWYKHEIYNDDSDEQLLRLLDKLSERGIDAKNIKIHFGGNYTIIFYCNLEELKYL